MALNKFGQTRLSALTQELNAMTSKPRLTEQDEARFAEIEMELKVLEMGGTQADGWRPADYREGVIHRINRSGSTAYTQRTADTPEGVFCRWARTGDPAAESELRAYNNVDLITSVDAEGGVVVPTEMLREVIARRDEQMLAVKLGCRKIPGNAMTTTIPIDAENDVVYTAVNEAASISQDSPALSEVSLVLQKYAKFTTISWELQLSEDANLLEFLTGWMARGMSATHNQLLVAEVLANATAALTADAAAAIGAGEIPELAGKIAPEYKDVAPGAKWLMNPSTFSYLQGLQGTGFLFAPMPGGDPFKPGLWGHEVAQSSYMPVLAASAKSIVYGNFGYCAYRDPTALVVLRDQFSAASTGQIRFWSYFFTDYSITQGEALAYLTQSSA